ncbi:MAG: ATP-binding protein [Planctomycetota bacterium]
MITKQQLRILFVDDVRDSFLSWGRPLVTYYKLEVDYVDGVLAAKKAFLHALERKRYDAIVLDRYMPDPDRGGELSAGAGDKLLEFFLLQDPDVAVVMLSNETNVEVARRTNQRGAYALLSKGESQSQDIYREICGAVIQRKVEALYSQILTRDDFVESAMPNLAKILDLRPSDPGRDRSEDGAVSECGYASLGPRNSLRVDPLKSAKALIVREEGKESRAEFSELGDPQAGRDALQWIRMEEEQLQRLRTKKFLLLEAAVHDPVDWPHAMGGDVEYQCLLPIERHGPKLQDPNEINLLGVLCYQTKSKPILKDDVFFLQRIARAIGIAQSVWLFRNDAVAADGNFLAESLFEEYAHRIRSPLMTAQLAIDRMYDSENCPPDLESRLLQVRQAIADATESMRSLEVRNRSETYGKRELTPLSLERTFRELFSRYEPYQGRMFSLKASSDAPVLGNDRDLFYAFRCLLDNAIESVQKNGPEKPGKVQVSISTDPSAKRAVHIAIMDNGLGFDHDFPLHTLFDRGVSTKTTTGSGRRGLGLWEVRRIVEKHDGTVEALSAPKGGAYFSIVLPLAGETVGGGND